ncbi:MAG: SUMF1/EgtB/PvdO family nonheme iron enzyme, partial [Anaerolineae bacterium]|nr:SUMF1/EgtB/PvdO family nonheme iron enzyme [Anaerolineae bacterium]
MRKSLLFVALVLLLAGCGPTPAPTAAPAATAGPALGDTQIRAADGMVMVYVPAGEFTMGSAYGDADAEDDEKPRHTVYLEAYWIDRTEVTVAQFRAFVGATGYETTAEAEGWAEVYVASSGKWERVRGADWEQPYGPGAAAAEDDHPVVQVSW